MIRKMDLAKREFLRETSHFNYKALEPNMNNITKANVHENNNN